MTAPSPESLALPEPCPRKKCGEYNMLKCCARAGHKGECCFVVDHENDYAHNKKPRLRALKEKTNV